MSRTATTLCELIAEKPEERRFVLRLRAPQAVRVAVRCDIEETTTGSTITLSLTPAWYVSAAICVAGGYFTLQQLYYTATHFDSNIVRAVLVGIVLTPTVSAIFIGRYISSRQAVALESVESELRSLFVE
jgi:hypothetical protein